MKVNYNDKLYIVHWQHDRDTYQIGYGVDFDETVIMTKGGATRCSIQEGPKQNCKMISNATAYCSENDTYCKATGRKVSLTYALKKCDNKDFRKAVWEQYRKECRS